MTDFLGGLLVRQREQNQSQREGFWTGHSVFQIPYAVVSYKGRAEALLLIYLYERAGSVPRFCTREVIIELKVKLETLCARTGLEHDAVLQAIKTLEAAGTIRVQRNRSLVTGRKTICIYVLLHPETNEPLKAVPNAFGICHVNDFPTPYLTVPRETREVLKQLKPAARAVYMTALAIASKFMMTSYGARREDLKAESLLGKNAFNRGLKQCLASRLFAYKKSTLTLHDPRTRKPSERKPHEFIHHAHPNWRFNLDGVTPEQWQCVVEAALRKSLFVGPNGWTYTRPEVICPSCKRERCFSANFALSQFKCHDCGASGRLFQLVARVLRMNTRDTMQFIRDRRMDQKPPTAQAA